jgi:pimeloyl-ACP methyl ester carboxylesterase
MHEMLSKMMARTLSVLAVAGALIVGPTGAAWAPPTPPPTLDRPIIFIHGFNENANTDCDMWDGIKNAFRDRTPQATGALITIKYYSGDTGCSSSINGVGSHNKHHGDGDATHDKDTDIRHLGYHLAWWLYSVWGAGSGDVERVDIVAHSMGGLITRYALAQVARGHEDFPPSLPVQDVVTLGTPHDGVDPNLYRLCDWSPLGSSPKQCGQMRSNSDFMDWMRDNAMNPKPNSRVDWTVIGSYGDRIVSEVSAVSMSNGTTGVAYVVAQGQYIDHSDYYRGPGLNLGQDAKAAIRLRGSDTYRNNSSTWWPAKWAQWSLFFEDQ